MLAALLAGCASNSSTTSRSEATQRASYAATAKLPAERQPSDLHIAVLVKGDHMRLVNFTDDTIRNADIWINGTFVHHIDALPARGSVTLLKSAFYDTTGHSFADVSTPTHEVTVQQGNTVSTTLGPVNE